jgi:hypothetical protein
VALFFFSHKDHFPALPDPLRGAIIEHGDTVRFIREKKSGTASSLTGGTP